MAEINIISKAILLESLSDIVLISEGIVKAKKGMYRGFIVCGGLFPLGDVYGD